MDGQSRRAAEDQSQMEDQSEFQEDPRGRQRVSDQQPETQPAEDGEDRRGKDPEDSRAETGRDDGGEATGNPPNAG